MSAYLVDILEENRIEMWVNNKKIDSLSYDTEGQVKGFLGQARKDIAPKAKIDACLRLQAQAQKMGICPEDGFRYSISVDYSISGKLTEEY